MGNRAKITRSVVLGDETRVARHSRVPELGPRILFFSGGSALRGLSRKLKKYTHNSVHLITPFDSGGSSSTIRKAFRMLSVGDLRNRLMALADESQRGNPQIYRLFSHRFPKTASQVELGERLERMVEGTDPLISEVPNPFRRIVRTHLRVFAENMPPSFDLRGASIGNLVLAAGYLNNDRDIDSVIYLFSKLVEVRGTVQPTVRDDLHLKAVLEDGSTILGQHSLTGKEHSPISCAVKELSLVRDFEKGEPAKCEIDDKVRKMILRADVIVFPMGSFFSSILANLLPAGVGAAVRDAECPKLYIPNTGVDPEQIGLSLEHRTELLLRYLRRDAGENTPTNKLLNFVLLDETARQRTKPNALEKTSELGIDLLETRLISEQSKPDIDSELLARVLVSMG
ncbi:MAG: GAK system CofD-like protein [Planctomycetes bacterium]|nr:GAK system CofD-like protein [Planctomycetota bacterium]MCA8935955.1 GAK system CofD-like protein [Planctomycetota bacterium]MCA8946120.1 GAK system CofD-like protein [Planctomycetota bacterium]